MVVVAENVAAGSSLWRMVEVDDWYAQSADAWLLLSRHISTVRFTPRASEWHSDRLHWLYRRPATREQPQLQGQRRRPQQR